MDRYPVSFMIEKAWPACLAMVNYGRGHVQHNDNNTFYDEDDIEWLCLGLVTRI